MPRNPRDGNGADCGIERPACRHSTWSFHSAGGGERQYGRSLGVVEMANCAVSLNCEMGDACRLAGRWDCSGVRGDAPLRGPQHILPPTVPLDTTTTNVPTAKYASGEQHQHTYPHTMGDDYYTMWDNPTAKTTAAHRLLFRALYIRLHANEKEHEIKLLQGTSNVTGSLAGTDASDSPCVVVLFNICSFNILVGINHTISCFPLRQTGNLTSHRAGLSSSPQ